jgi:UDP-N-acetylmuramate--alanine ligase
MIMSTAPYQKHIHLVGIGGTGLSAIAKVLLERGTIVSGSDQRLSPILERLGEQGARIYVGHAAEHIGSADLVVVSSAIPEDNPEVVAARESGIPVLKRSEFIGSLMAGYYSIAVAGTHGKTTTTAMIAFIMTEAGLSPSFIIGGLSCNLGTNAAAGHGPHFVIEADEYDYMFLGLQPDVAVVTNIEMDHPDCFECMEDMTEAFAAFLRRVPPGGHIIVNGDDGRVRDMLVDVDIQEIETFGLSQGLNWRASDVKTNKAGGQTFSVWHDETALGPFELQVPGIHNVLNALAAIAATTEVDTRLNSIRDSLSRFKGTERRFEHKGTASGVVVIDDYAHHPTEIRATLAAAHARYAGRTIWAVFQPHTYSRFKFLFRDFAGSFQLADHVIVTDIFASRERDTLGIRAQDIVRIMDHPDVHHVSGFDEVVGFLMQRLHPGDVCITLGAGDCNLLGEKLLDELRAHPLVEDE